MRRAVGVGGIKKRKETESKFKEKGSELASGQLESLSGQLESFREKLEDFAAKHKNEIRKDPQFRRQFQEMCASIGVDPLASGKGFWAEQLGVGDFYYELGVQIIEVCLATSHLNGGLITLDELRKLLTRSRNRRQKDEVSNDDLLRAISKLKVLGSGFTVISLSDGSFLVQSVPGELNMDHTRVLQEAEKTSSVNVSGICRSLQWEKPRSEAALNHLTKEGLCWIDTQTGSEPLYWFPTFFMKQRKTA